ncbi:MAG TPA: universal stress protein [Gaiellaceae bacterium]|nr:universal stress protein [Gaiellaceae bacterium]
MKIERILVGTDRSETATRAVKWALDMARRYGAELIVLQAGGDTAELERYVQNHAPGARWRVDTDVDPAASIIAAAEAEDVDVIVVGNVGMSGRREFLLGNIPNRVSHNARCTVIIVDTSEPEGFRLPWKKR